MILLMREELLVNRQVLSQKCAATVAGCQAESKEDEPERIRYAEVGVVQDELYEILCNVADFNAWHTPRRSIRHSGRLPLASASATTSNSSSEEFLQGENQGVCVSLRAHDCKAKHTNVPGNLCSMEGYAFVQTPLVHSPKKVSLHEVTHTLQQISLGCFVNNLAG